MTGKLFAQALIKFILGAILVGLLLFIPAGTFSFPNGWLFMGILFIPMFIVGIVLMVRDPGLLEKRLDARESEGEQKKVVALSGMMFLAAFIIAGLNFRFSWIVMPSWSVLLGAVIFLGAYLMYGEVLRENSYLSRTIDVQEDQKVVDTGLYAIVRHPMYSGTLFLFLSMGLVLGSPISFAILLLYIPIIVKRIRNEEKVLAEGLKGYEEYMEIVRYRLIPYIW